MPALETRLLADARKVMGAGKVKLITICTVQIAPLHPVQTPAPDAPPDDAARGTDAQEPRQIALRKLNSA